MDEFYNAVGNQITAAVNYNNAWSAEQAQKQMDFQREMSNTAHVREIADLKAAGLNPVLSAKLGGASTPSGAAASADTSAVTAVTSLATEFMRQMAEGFASGAISGYGSAKSNYLYSDTKGYQDDLKEFQDAMKEQNKATSDFIKLLPFKWRGFVTAAVQSGLSQKKRQFYEDHPVIHWLKNPIDFTVSNILKKSSGVSHSKGKY